MRANFQGKDKAMRHTPFGYEIIDGVARVNEEEAGRIRTIILGYLGGLALTNAAREAGLELSHASVKRILTNKKYLGDGFYPQIIDDETALEIEKELEKRSTKLGRNNRAKKEKKLFVPETSFKLRPVGSKYDDPIAQAEYAYSMIESGVE